MEWAVVAATVVGPVAAVIITLWYQASDRRYQRKVAVFSTMMRWRRHILAVDFVGSLNLVPVEFSNSPKVVSRYQELFQLFEDSGWRSEDLVIRNRLIDSINSKTTELLSAMASDLHIKIDQIQILKSAYAPQGWADEEERSRNLRDRAEMLLRGEIRLPVEIHPPQEAEASQQ